MAGDMNATGIPTVQPERAAEAVVRVIEGLIREGSLRPGDMMLPERELSERMNVSRPTLRDGLRVLEEKGLLISEGRGLQVAAIGHKAIRDPLMTLLAGHGALAQDYLEFRDIVESQAAALAAERATEADCDRIRSCMADIEAAHEAGDVAQEAAVDAELHMAIYEASHNIVLLQIMRALSDGLRQDVLRNREQLFLRPAFREALRDQHRAIAMAILSHDPAAALVAAHGHLAWLKQAAQEIQAAQARTELAERRIQGAELTLRRRRAD